MTLDKIQRDRVNRYLACLREADLYPLPRHLAGMHPKATYYRLLIEAGQLHADMSEAAKGVAIKGRSRDFRS